MNAFEKPREGKSDFGRLVRYLTDPQRHKRKPGDRERVIAVRATNLYNDMVNDPEDYPEGLEDAIAEVHQLQSRNYRATERTLHLLLTFREDLDLDTLAEIEERVVQYLGYGDHQRISVVHGDKENLHVHIAINKVYRTTNKRGREVFLNRHPDFSHMRLARLCGVIERAYGLEQDNRTEKQWDDRRPNRTDEEAKAREALRGDGWMDEAKQATSWEELLEISRARGVELKAMGKSGLRMVTASGSIAAGKLGRGFRRGELERRFGPMPSMRAPQASPRRTQSLATRVKRAAGAELRAADGWSALHAIAERHGLRLLRRGGGLAFEDISTGEMVSASSVYNSLSLGRAEARLGTYQPAVLSPTVQLREAVVELSEDRAKREHQERSRVITEMMVDPAQRRARLVESRRVLAHDRELIRELHTVGHRLDTTLPSEWRQIELENPSALAVFREYAIALRMKFPVPELAPRAQEHHLSQHLYEERVRTLGRTLGGTSQRRLTDSLVRPRLDEHPGRQRKSLVRTVPVHHHHDPASTIDHHREGVRPADVQSTTRPRGRRR